LRDEGAEGAEIGLEECVVVCGGDCGGVGELAGDEESSFHCVYYTCQSGKAIGGFVKTYSSLAEGGLWNQLVEVLRE